MKMTEKCQRFTVRCMEWELAKAYLERMTIPFISTDEGYDSLRSKIDSFIKDIEDNEL